MVLRHYYVLKEAAMRFVVIDQDGNSVETFASPALAQRLANSLNKELEKGAVK